MDYNIISNNTGLTREESDTIQNLLKGIKTSSYDQESLYKRLICDSGEATMNVLLKLAKDIFRDGYNSSEKSIVIGEHKIYTIKPNEYSVVLAAEHIKGTRNIAFFMEQNGKPNPEIDRIIEKMFEQARQKHGGEKEQEQDNSSLSDQEFLKELTDKDRVKEITAFKYYLPNRNEIEIPNTPLDFASALEKIDQSAGQYQSTLEQSIDTILADKYLLDKALKVSKSLSFSRDGWMRASGEDWGDNWQLAFDIIRGLLEQSPEETKNIYISNTVDFSERYYEPFELSSSRMVIESIADNLNRFSGYLLGAKAIEGLEMAEKVFKENSIKSYLSNLTEIYDFCKVNNHTDREHRFSHNDLDNHVYTVSSHIKNLNILVFSDQNRKFICSIQKNGGLITGLRVHVFSENLEDAFDDWVRNGCKREELEWVNNDHIANPFSTPRFYDYTQALSDATNFQSYDCPTLLAAFVINGDQVSMVNKPSLDLEMIKCWNSFIPDIGCAHCCLEEEYPRVENKI